MSMYDDVEREARHDWLDEREAAMADDTGLHGVTDLEEMAWVILANVSEGDWTKQPEEWQKAVTRWRDQYHAKLSAGSAFP